MLIAHCVSGVPLLNDDRQKIVSKDQRQLTGAWPEVSWRRQQKKYKQYIPNLFCLTVIQVICCQNWLARLFHDMSSTDIRRSVQY